MREIIFRAWDGKKLSIGKAEYFDDSVNFRFHHFDIDCDRPVLEQYTGLKDKNGKMIFEGDEIDIRITGFGTIGEWAYGGTVVYLGAGFKIEGRTSEGKTWHGLNNTGWEYEIIGNIHEEEKK
jgi:uncharacterized phage protein (TIGR01671 family)